MARVPVTPQRGSSVRPYDLLVAEVGLQGRDPAGSLERDVLRSPQPKCTVARARPVTIPISGGSLSLKLGGSTPQPKRASELALMPT